MSLAITAFACAFACAIAAADNHRCASVPDPAKRLACYDEAFPLPAETREAAARIAVEEFGLQQERSELGRAAEESEAVDPEKVESRVAKVAHDGRGRRTITLDNGQVWRLTEATSKGQTRVGETAIVRKGLVGNFMLVTEAGVGLRVSRVR